MARQDIEAGRAFVRLTLNDSALLRGLRNAQQKLRSFGTSAQAAGQQLAIASAAMLGPLAVATRIFSGFDDAMRAVKAVSQSTSAEFERLTALAKKLGASTSFTAVQVANLMTELGRAGFTASQIEHMTGAVLDLARATGTDATLASGIMAATIRQFSLEAGEAVRVADALTATANKSFNTVEQLGEALSYAGPVAADFGVSLEEALAILGTLGNVGIQASNAGTAVRRLLTLTGAEAEKMQGIFGVAFMDAAGNARPLVDVLEEVNAATANLGTAERAKKFNEAFGLLGITGASAISKAAGSTRELLAAIQDAGGIASKTAKEMDAGLGGSFRKFMSAAEGVAIKVAGVLAPAMQIAADLFTALAQRMIGFIDKNRGLVMGIAAAGLVIGGLATALIGIGFAAQIASIAIGSLLMVLGAVKVSLAVLASPLLLIGGALAAGATAWAVYSGAGKRAINSLVGVFRPFLDIAKSTLGGVKDALAAGDLAMAGRIAVTGLRVALLDGMGKIAGMFDDVWADAIGTFATQLAGGDFQGAWNTTVTSMAAVWDVFTEGIVNTFTDAARDVTDVWEKTVNTIANQMLKLASGDSEIKKALEKALGREVTAGGAAGAALGGGAMGLAAGSIAQAVRGGGAGAFTATPGFLVREAIGTYRDLSTVEEEKFRGGALDQLRKDRGLNVAGDVGTTTQEAVTDTVGSTADKIRSALDALDDDARRRAEKSKAELGERTAGGKSKLDEALDQARADLAALKEQVARDREAAAQAAQAAARGGGGAGGGLAAAAGAVGSFSSVALQSLGMGPQDRILRVNEEQRRLLQQAATLQEQMLLALHGLGGLVAQP